MSTFIVPPWLKKKPETPVGLAVSVGSVVTEKGVRLEIRIQDPRDPYKRQHGMGLDIDTLSPPKDAPPPS